MCCTTRRETQDGGMRNQAAGGEELPCSRCCGSEYSCICRQAATPVGVSNGPLAFLINDASSMAADEVILVFLFTTPDKKQTKRKKSHL